MIVTDESVDANGIKKLPLYVRWRGKKVQISRLNRNAYFLSLAKTVIVPPSFQEIKEKMEEFLKDGELVVALPSWPMNFVENTVNLLSLVLKGIRVNNLRTDSVVLSHLLNNGVNVEKADKIVKRAKTYLLFCDLSFLRRNGLLPEEKNTSIMTKSTSLVKYINGRVSVKTSWSFRRVISKIMDEVGEEKFTLYIYHSGKKRMANVIASTFLEKFKCETRLGWMNPAVASQFGHGTVSVTIVPEV